MSKRIEAIKAALAVAQPNDRLWVLKKAAARYATINIGAFCAKIGASEDEKDALILDRAAQEGLLDEDNLIK